MLEIALIVHNNRFVFRFNDDSIPHRPGKRTSAAR
jgi:hypothetical protein